MKTSIEKLKRVHAKSVPRQSFREKIRLVQLRPIIFENDPYSVVAADVDGIETKGI